MGGGLLSYQMTPWVKRLLLINFAAFVAVNMMGLAPWPWVRDTFGFSVATFLRHPWSPLTYMFVHGSFLHIFFNMLILFFFGPPLERAWGSREFLKFYLICGIGAALTSLLLVQIVGMPTVVGASGALYGVMLAFALKWPNAPVLIWFVLPVKVKYLVGFMVFMDFWATLNAGRGAGGGVATWAHLGGAATALIYLKYGNRIERRLRRMRPGRARLGVEQGGRRRGRRRTEGDPSRPVDGDTLDEVDRILDKIKDGGIESLKPEEKSFLDEMSRRYRGGE
jgi:membrane associated rhomboid family serine protease